MPITEFLTKNAKQRGDLLCLTEINPELEEKRELTWKESALVEPGQNPYRKELTWSAFDERANKFCDLIIKNIQRQFCTIVHFRILDTVTVADVYPRSSFNVTEIGRNAGNAQYPGLLVENVKCFLGGQASLD